MTNELRNPWVTAVRVLAIVSFVLLSIAVAEGVALRRFRAELQQARAACGPAELRR